MSKRTILTLLILLGAALSLACSCLPSTLLERYLLTDQPAPPEPTLIPAADGFDPAAVCSDELGDLLWEAEQEDLPGRELPMEYILAKYEVVGDAITNPDLPSVPLEIKSFQQDVEKQREIWAFIAAVVPGEARKDVSHFILFTDGPAGTLGAVEQTSDPDEWMIEVDIQDADSISILTTTLIHEVAHLLTLNTLQVVTDFAVFNDSEDGSAFAEGQAACSTYFLFEGCSTPDSYLNLFFERYWGDVYGEWLEIDQDAEEGTVENLLSDFYGRHASQFVSRYAVTSPEEDIAESFLYFVLSPQPAGETTAEEKLLFFFEYPELVSLREQMRTSLCPVVMP